MKKICWSLVGGIALLGVGCAAQTAPSNEPLAGVCQSAEATATPWLDGAQVAEVQAWKVREGKQMMWRHRGARIYLAPQPSMTAGWLQELVDCSISRGGTASDPLAVPGVKARVATSGDGFVIEVEAPGRTEAGEVLRRARAIRG